MKKDSISYEDFSKLDFRIGEVKEASSVEGSHKLVSLVVDLGEDYGKVQILAGIAGIYNPEEIVGKKMIFLANLEPKKMMGTQSNGMMIAANDSDKPVLIFASKELANGVELC